MKRRIDTGISRKIANFHWIVRYGKKNEILEVLSKIDPAVLLVPNGYGETALHLVGANTNLLGREIVEFLAEFLDRGLVINVNVQDRRGKTVLHLAIERRMKDAADLLVSHGADVCKLDCEGNSPAHEFVRIEYRQIGFGRVSAAAEAESVDFLESMIAMGLDFDVRHETGMSATQLAIEHELDHVLHVLVRHIRDVNVVDRRGKSLLHLLLEKRESRRNAQNKRKKNCNDTTTLMYFDMVKTLLDRGFSSWSRDGVRDRTSLQAAIECQEDARVVEMLLDDRLKSVERHSATRTLAELLECCSRWDESRIQYFLEILRCLIAKGADVDGKDKNGRTPAYHAIHGNNMPVIRFLDDHGADFSASNEEGENAYHALAQLGSFDNPISDECLNALLDFVASKGRLEANARNSAEETPLHWAARCGNLAVAKHLVERGAEVNCEDAIGDTPLHHAVLYARSDSLTKLLLKSGADVNSRDERGRRALSIALDVHSDMELAALLLKRGAHARNADLRRAVVCNDYRVARMMLACGADINDEVVVARLTRFPAYEVGRAWPYPLDRLFLLRHWVRLRAAGLPYAREYAVNHEWGEVIHRHCLKEIETLKSTILDDRSSSVYAFLHMNFNGRRAYVNNQQLQSLVDSQMLEEDFPNYSEVILAGYRETLAWKSLLGPARQAWRKFTKIALPDECLERIFGHLGNEDLVRMIEYEDNL